MAPKSLKPIPARRTDRKTHGTSADLKEFETSEPGLTVNLKSASIPCTLPSHLTWTLRNGTLRMSVFLYKRVVFRVHVSFQQFPASTNDHCRWTGSNTGRQLVPLPLLESNQHPMTSMSQVEKE